MVGFDAADGCEEGPVEASAQSGCGLVGLGDAGGDAVCGGRGRCIAGESG
jgi:hypothetical protein